MKNCKINAKKFAWLVVLLLALGFVGLFLFSSGKWEIVEKPKHGQISTMTSKDGSFHFEYIPDKNFIGRDVFTIKAVFPFGLMETEPVPIELEIDKCTIHVIGSKQQ